MGLQKRARVPCRAYVTPWPDYLFVSIAELNKILKNTGWRVSEYLDDFKTDLYIAVIERV